MKIHSYWLSLCLFIYSHVHAEQVCDSKQIRASTPTQQFVVRDDGTVLDSKTGLIWQRCPLGQSGKQCGNGEAVLINWADALLEASKANGQGWRLPNIRELASLVELQCGRPAINLTVFPNQAVSHLWSSSPYRFYDHYAWYLDLEDGVYIYGDRQDKKQLRLVKNSHQL